MPMRPRTRDKISRILLAALMRSGLTPGELRELHDDLVRRDAEFLADFGRLLGDVLHHFRELESKKSYKFWNQTSEHLKAAYTAIQRRRLSKRAVLDIMLDISSGIEGAKISPELPLKHLLQLFFESASQLEARRFVNTVRGETDGDAYLRGIIRRG